MSMAPGTYAKKSSGTIVAIERRTTFDPTRLGEVDHCGLEPQQQGHDVGWGSSVRLDLAGDRREMLDQYVARALERLLDGEPVDEPVELVVVADRSYRPTR